MPLIEIFGGLQTGSAALAPSGVTPGDYASPTALRIDTTGLVTAAYEVWNSGFTYRNADRVLDSNSNLHVSQQPNNLNHNPVGDDGTWWKLWGIEFILVAGTRAFTGNQSMGGNKLTNLGAPTADGDAATKLYVDTAVVGLLDYKGGYNAATNTPDLDTAPSGIKKGDAYTVTAAGAFFTENVEIGDTLVANIDNAAALADWIRIQANWGIDNSTIELSSGNLRVKDAGISFAKLNVAAFPMGFYVDLLSGNTPGATGADAFEFIVPHLLDGSSGTFTFVLAKLRVANAGTSGNPAAKIQRATLDDATSALAWNDIINAIAVTGNQTADVESETSAFLGGQTTCSSGDKLRANVTVLGTGTTGWHLVLLAKRTA